MLFRSNINYRIDHGEKDQPWLILIHGLFGSLDNLAMLRRKLNQDFNILSIDLPDHGKSEHSARFSFTDYAESIIALLAQLNISRANVVAHSLGGKVAMQMALTHPEIVSTLTVLDIAPVAYEPRHSNVFKSLLNVKLESIQDRKDADNMMSEFVNESSVRQFLLKSLYQDTDTHLWRWRFNLPLLYSDYPLLSQAISSDSQYPKPVLFLKGEMSDYLITDYTKQTTDLFPKSRVKVISGVGHWLHAEKPTECANHILTFLRN